MKQGWEIKKLREVCEIKPPKNEAKKTLKDTDLVSFLPMEDLGVMDNRITAVKERTLKEVAGSYTYFANNDVLLAKITPCFENGKIGIARNLTNGIGFGSSEYMVFRNKGLILEDFLFYYLSREKFREEGKKNMTGAVGHKRVSKEFIENYEIPLPPLPEQQRIVSLLDEAFAAIAKAKANAEQNLKNAKELFESYLHSVFEEKGSGWKEETLGEVCVFTRGPFGGSLKKNIFKPGGYAVYEQQHAINKQFDNVRYFIDEEKFTEMKRFELKSGDLIMSCSGTMGKVAIVPIGIKLGIINQALLKIRTGKKILNSYLQIWMESESFQKSLRKHSGGAAIQNVASVSVLKSIKVLLPSVEQQQTIVHQLDSLRAETTKLEAIYQQKLLNLEELKKSVLQKAFNGDL